MLTTDAMLSGNWMFKCSTVIVENMAAALKKIKDWIKYALSGDREKKEMT